MTDTLEKRTLKRSKAVRLAAFGGVIGPILFAVMVIIGGAVYDGYSHISQKISELGGEGAEYAIIQNLNFVMLGVFVLGLSWALARVLGPPYLGPALVGYFGLILAVHSVLPCDPRCNGQTTIGLLHNVTGISAFIATIAGMFVLARRWRHDADWGSHARLTRRIAFVAIGGLAWFVITQALEFSLGGIAQRVFVGALFLWIALTAWHLYRQLDTDEPDMEIQAGGPPAR